MVKRCILILGIGIGTIAVFLMSLLMKQPAQEILLKAESGRLDLSSWDMEDMPSIPLDGEWEFYWNALLTPEDFQNASPPIPTGYMTVPSLWNGKTLQGKELPVFGCATYRLVLTGIRDQGVFGLKRNNARFSSRVYVNDRELIADGVPALEASDYRSGNTPKTVFFNYADGNLEILVQVANYEYINSGIPVSIELGSKEAMLDKQRRDFIFPFSVFVILVIISVLHLVFFLVALAFGRRETMLLLFSVCCLIVALSISLTDQRPLLFLLPELPFTLIFKFKDFFMSATFPVLFFIIYKFRIGIIPTRLIKWIFLCYGTYLTAILILPIRIYYQAMPVATVVTMVFLSFLLVRAAICFIQRSKGLLLFIAMLAVNLYVTDVFLFTHGLISNSNSGQIYILIFALIMFIFLSIQYYETMQGWKQSVQRMQDAEIAFLRAQINPHFLYNALNSIAALCTEAPDKAEDAVVELSMYLRRSFDFKRLDSMTTLAKEKELLEAYLYIEKIRFGNRLLVEFDIEEGLNIPVPPLILQPLVENAVRHGLMQQASGGIVSISIRSQGEEAVFTITDNGIGMEDGMLEHLLEENTGKRGIGLWNINRRLNMLYGQGLAVSSKTGKGTSVTFSLPLKQHKAIMGKRGQKR